jgi:uncharacterized protein YndB with AHSA1/START domain
VNQSNSSVHPSNVYRAHTDPKKTQQWMLGPEGWTMPVCINEARPGGKIRFEWTNGKGGGFHLTGEYVELHPCRKIIHFERMHLPDPTPDNQVETRFDADGTGTLMTMRMTLPDAETRGGHAGDRDGKRHGSKLCAFGEPDLRLGVFAGVFSPERAAGPGLQGLLRSGGFLFRR